MSNMYDGLFSTKPRVTLVYSELEAHSEPCQISMIKNYVTCKVIFWVIFQAYLRIFKRYSRAYSHIFRDFSIPGIFRTLTYSKVRLYLDLCQTYCLWKIVPGYNDFCRTLLLRPF